MGKTKQKLFVHHQKGPLFFMRCSTRIATRHIQAKPITGLAASVSIEAKLLAVLDTRTAW
jgi:hypothetical protein